MSKNRLATKATLTLALLLVAVVLAGYMAAAATTVSITGYVRDQDHKLVQQAIVTLYSNKSKVDMAGNPALTDANGTYKITGIGSNIYSVEVEKNGFSYTETVMISGTDVVLNVTLPGHTSALVTTPAPPVTPKPTPTPTATPSPTPTPTPAPTPAPTPTPTAKPSPGFGMVIVLAGIGLAIMARKR